jgi:hypothetical protein
MVIVANCGERAPVPSPAHQRSGPIRGATPNLVTMTPQRNRAALHRSLMPHLLRSL